MKPFAFAHVASPRLFDVYRLRCSTPKGQVPPVAFACVYRASEEEGNITGFHIGLGKANIYILIITIITIIGDYNAYDNSHIS